MKDDNGKIILAMLAGASAGLVAGILMAPEAGEATRGNLKKSASKLGSGLGSTLQGLGSSAGALLGRVTGGGDPEVVNTGSNTTPTSHLDNNPTGGNVSGATGAAGDATTNDVSGSANLGTAGAAGDVTTGTNTADNDTAGNTPTKPKRASRAKGSTNSGGSGGGSNATA
ncbi:YtxH domain-containing protein [Rufibacter immobilis]|uniref:YtxH domain-containing protein n=2 Tax=Rufibacter immobilis TaxID=1348778 RepID=A0A3M9MVG0_9BACT|nr:YtxH domain-containing protein [Rufibacter immobilis]